MRRFRQGMYAAQPARRDDGLVRGRLCRLLPVPPPRAHRGRPVIDAEGWVCPVPLRDSPTIVMGHGGGGALSAELVQHLFLPAYGVAAKGVQLGDSAVVPVGNIRLAFSTDSFVVKPMFFPGG